ncbi:hypothetical protein [Anaeropeptidivorans aminofermentans]|uniref:hypothetical protein n=1 Tax=Anaeropeptidivorans aminofermentans TaxID=2934315 RepID=UPI002025B040|nr:hypothetical protein [Anaeropeptidivorans aminofermentans]MBE6012154.1 hypothetical protein [Lachnospiraceae bacterium]
MKTVQILGNKVHWITPYPSLEEASLFAPDIILKEAPDYIEEGYLYDAESDTFLPSDDSENNAEPPATLDQLKDLIINANLSAEENKEMILVLASAIAEVYERLDAEALK